MIQACIFDLDGVIVDTAHYHFLAWKRLANELGFDLTEEQNEKLKGISRIQSLDILLSIGEIEASSAEKLIMADRKNNWFVEYIEKMSPNEIFPGVKDILHDLRAKGLKTALASSSKNAKRVVNLLGIENEFDTLVDGTMIIHSKPHPEIFLLAAHRLQIAPGQCVVFEDAEAGVEAALAAGMKCIGVGSPQLLSKANKVILRTGDFELSCLQELEIV